MQQRSRRRSRKRLNRRFGGRRFGGPLLSTSLKHSEKTSDNLNRIPSHYNPIKKKSKQKINVGQRRRATEESLDSLQSFPSSFHHE